MNLVGVRLTLLIGQGVPTPAPTNMLEALESLQVTHSDEQRSGFQLTLRAGRGPTDLLDYGLLASPLLRPFNRVVLLVTFNVVPEVLFDGVITHQQLNPGEEPGTSTLTVTGEDATAVMDLEEKSVEHPAQNEFIIALKLIGSYAAQYGLIPSVIPPPTLDTPLPTERIPVQQGTDLAYLQEMAARHAYVFYITPGPAPLTNTAYWGPPARVGLPQKALSANMGPDSNVESIDFQYNGLGPSFTEGFIQDSLTNQAMPIKTAASLRLPLSSQPAWATQSQTRTRQLRQSGLNTMQAFARAQAETDASNDTVLTATGTLDATRYEALLQPRGLVGVRGVGYSYSGFYYVKSVTHNVRVGEYKQNFTLTRDGLGSTTPVVRP